MQPFKVFDVKREPDFAGKMAMIVDQNHLGERLDAKIWGRWGDRDLSVLRLEFRKERLGDESNNVTVVNDDVATA